MDTTRVILVDESDHPVGTAGKLEAHLDGGQLHRAFSVFIFNDAGDMLLQQRALDKYHSGGLWTNACCSHPAPGEATDAAALRRLQEELGFITPVRKIFDFVYRASFDNGLTEYEFDHVFTGVWNNAPQFNPAEVMDFCYMPVEELRHSLATEPARYTAWFHLAFPRVYEWWSREYKQLKQTMR